jgi:hypothetical protein
MRLTAEHQIQLNGKRTLLHRLRLKLGRWANRLRTLKALGNLCMVPLQVTGHSMLGGIF